MEKRPQYFALIGIGILTLVVLFLTVSPDFIFSPAVTVIGGDPNKASTNQVTVATRTDFSDPEQMAAFPLDIGSWRGKNYDSAPYMEVLKAKVVMVRGYQTPDFARTLVLVVVQGDSNSGIHEPHYCFPNIQEQTREELLVNSPDWTANKSGVIIPLNKLVSVENAADGTMIARRLVLYFYVKSNQFYSDNIALVEVQALAPFQGSYAETLQTEKEFMSQVIPLMFQPASESKWRPVAVSLIELGIVGYFIIGILVLIPVGFILYQWRRSRGVGR